ncbi:MAG: hypothetical protein ABIH34_00225 [Nanoarchaeota archaeon]
MGLNDILTLESDYPVREEEQAINTVLGPVLFSRRYHGHDLDSFYDVHLRNALFEAIEEAAPLDELALMEAAGAIEARYLVQRTPQGLMIPLPWAGEQGGFVSTERVVRLPGVHQGDHTHVMVTADGQESCYDKTTIRRKLSNTHSFWPFIHRDDPLVMDLSPSLVAKIHEKEDEYTVDVSGEIEINESYQGTFFMGATLRYVIRLSDVIPRKLDIYANILFCDGRGQLKSVLHRISFNKTRFGIKRAAFMQQNFVEDIRNVPEDVGEPYHFSVYGARVKAFAQAINNLDNPPQLLDGVYGFLNRPLMPTLSKAVKRGWQTVAIIPL